MALDENQKNKTQVDGQFRFRIRKAPNGPYASVEAFKASPAYSTINNVVEGRPDTVGTVYVSYKLYEGDVWVRYDFEDENSRVAFKDYVLEAGHDLGLKSIEVGLDFATFPTYGFLA